PPLFRSRASGRLATATRRCGVYEFRSPAHQQQRRGDEKPCLEQHRSVAGRGCCWLFAGSARVGQLGNGLGDGIVGGGGGGGDGDRDPGSAVGSPSSLPLVGDGEWVGGVSGVAVGCRRWRVTGLG